MKGEARRRAAKERERWDPGVRRDRLNPYRPPWHRLELADLALIPPAVFADLVELARVFGLPAEDGLYLLALLEDAERGVSRADLPALAARAAAEVLEGRRLLELAR